MGVTERSRELWNEPGDPRQTQKRLGTSPSGRQVWVEITSDDRLAIIRRLPSRWPDVIMARERGESLDAIARWAKCPPPCMPGCRIFHPKASDSGLAVVIEGEGEHEGPACLRYLVAECYNFVESQLFDLTARRARLMP